MGYPKNLKDRVAIVGVGRSEFGKRLNRTSYSLGAEAFKNALDDCGLSKGEIDGLQTSYMDSDRMVRVLGLNTKYANQHWFHGRVGNNVILSVVQLLAAGYVNYAAIIYAFANRVLRIMGEKPFTGDRIRPEEYRDGGGGPHGENPPYGIVGIYTFTMAMWARRYFHLYGCTSQDLGQYAVSQRKWAAMNPWALFRDPLTIEAHQQSRMILDPLRLADCGMMAHGGTCLILTTAERAKNLKKKPIYISGINPIGYTPKYFTEDMPWGEGRDIWGAKEKITVECIDEVFRMAEVDREDIDILYCYDNLSPRALFILELTGFCKPGEAFEFIKGGRIEPGGDLPMNPESMLTGQHLCGMSELIDAVQQLRGECDERRQVKGARVAAWKQGTDNDLVILRC